MLKGAGTNPAALSPLLHPGYIVGRYYRAPGIIGVSTADTQPINSLRAMPFRVFYPVTIDRLAIRVATGVVGNAKCGVYRASAAAGGAPDGLVAEVNADIATGVAGDFEAGFSANPLLVPDLYWIATCCSAAANLNTISAALSNGLEDRWGSTAANGALGPSAATKMTGFVRTAALTYVAASQFFPASFGAGTLLENNPGAPMVAIRPV